MIRINIIFCMAIFMALSFHSIAQDEEINYTYQTFRDTRIVNGHSTETGTSGEMKFIIQHRFGTLNGGIRELYGLDQSSVRFGFDYSINGYMDIGFGRSSYAKLYDFYYKWNLIKQSTGARNMPISITYLTNAGISTMPWADPNRVNFFSSRVSYVNQFMMSRKFSPGFSFQFTFSHVHRNLVKTFGEKHDVFSLGGATRIQLTKVIALQAEYYYVLPNQLADGFTNSLSVGFEFQTRAHVFQIHLANSPSMVENLFITETDGSWLKGNIRLGFNMTRDFKIRPRKFRSL